MRMAPSGREPVLRSGSTPAALAGLMSSERHLERPLAPSRQPSDRRWQLVLQGTDAHKGLPDW